MMEKICRLCLDSTNDYVWLYEDEKPNEVHEIMSHYFHPEMLSLEHEEDYKVMCLECWRHIHEFHNFQVSIVQVQSKLKGVEHTLVEKITISTETSTTPVSIDNIYEDIIEEECVETNTTSSPYVEILDELTGTGSYEVTEADNCNASGEVDIAEVSEKPNNCPDLNLLLDAVNSVNEEIVETVYNKSVVVEQIQATTIGRLQTAVNGEELIAEPPHRKRKKHNPQSTSFGADNSRYYYPGSEHKESDSDPKSKDGKDKESDDIIAQWLPHLECTLCHESHPTFTLLKKHHRQKHKKGKFSVVCCQRNYTYRCQIEEHVRLHLDPNAFTCKVCDKRFSSRANLCTHKLSPCIPTYNANQLTKSKEESDAHISRWRPALLCEICFECCSTFTLLKEHYRQQHPSEEFYILCCERKFKYRCHVEEHASLHIDSNSFKCDLCGKCFTTGNNLQTHKSDSHPYLSGGDTSQMKNTKREGHEQSNRKSFKELDDVIAKWKPLLDCVVCKEQCVSFTHLSNHFSLKHKENELYIECCGRKFKCRAQAARHARLHMDPDSFACEVCGKGYTREFKLRHHIRLEHPNFETVLLDEMPGIVHTKQDE